MSANAKTDAPTVAVTSVGDAEGSRGAAAALACAGADSDLATLLVDVGGKPPRPTLIATTAAQRLEERLVAHLPQARIAARGQVCHLAVPAEPDGWEAASAAVTVARGALAVVHLPPALLRSATDEGHGPELSGVLLRADVTRDRALLALLARDLMSHGLSVAVLKQRLSWVAERRALFGALPPESSGLPPHVLRNFLSVSCYASSYEAEVEPASAGKQRRRDHARPASS